MSVEVNDAGETPDRAETPARRNRRVDSLPVLEGRLADRAITFRREDIYSPVGR